MEMNVAGNGRDPFQEDLPAYALDALDPEEADALEVHLATCPTCRAELEQFRMVATALGLSAGSGTEPAGHRDRFLQKLAATPAGGAAPAAVEPAGHRERFRQKLGAESAAAPADAGNGPLALPPRPPPAAVPARPRWWARLGVGSGWTLAGACALLLIAGLWGVDQQNRAAGTARQLGTLQTQATQVAGQVATAHAQATQVAGQVATAQAQATQSAAQAQSAQAQATQSAAQAQSAAAERDRLAAQLQHLTTEQAALVAGFLTDPAARPAPLAASATGPAGAHVILWLNAATGQAALAASDLPALPAGKVYELWLMQGKTPVAVDVFQASGGQALLPFALPGPASRYGLAAVTVEARKETAPTSAPILAGGL